MTPVRSAPRLQWTKIFGLWVRTNQIEKLYNLGVGGLAVSAPWNANVFDSKRFDVPLLGGYFCGLITEINDNRDPHQF